MSDEDLERLKRENERLRRKLRLAGVQPGGSLVSVAQDRSPLMSTPSVEGLSEAFVQVDGAFRILAINRRMGKLCGFAEGYREQRGAPLDRIDRIPWAPEALRVILEDARAEGREMELEIPYLNPASGLKESHVFRAAWRGEVGTAVVEDRSRVAQLYERFSRYVAPAVIRRMEQTGSDYMRADRYVLTALFADLRGFTSFSAGQEPETVRATINEYLSAMIEAVHAREGTVDKLVGDEVMALFGAPVRSDDHAFRAILTAVDMQRAHRLLMERWKAEGKPELPVGIGINTGEMVVGNIGSERRLDFTVLGHHVNLAARLCSAARGGEILVSTHTVEALKAFAAAHPDRMTSQIPFRRAEPVSCKGIEHPVPVASVVWQADGQKSMPTPTPSV